MAIPLELAGSNVPVGYKTPRFPSIYFPIGGANYEVSFLYYTYDVWRFTVFWTLIMFLGVHLVAAAFAASFSRSKWRQTVTVFAYFVILSSMQAFCAGSITGLILAAVYNAGLFAMSTWIPFTWALILTIFVVQSTYPIMAIIL